MANVTRKPRAFKDLAGFGVPSNDPKRVTGNGNFFTAFKQKGMSLTCGNVKKNVPFILWESVPKCSTDCCIVNICPEYTADSVKCPVQITYIRKVYGWFVDLIAKRPDTDAVKMAGIGLRLMPLYGQLIKLKIVEMGLGHGITMTGARGTTAIHPVFREIRDTMMAISKVQQELLKEAVAPADCNVVEIMGGEMSYYDALMDSGKKTKHKNDLGRAMGVTSVADDD